MFDIYCTFRQNHGVVHEIARLWPAKMLKDLLACQLMLATCLLSTWFGYQLASQSPNPSWHHSFLLKSPQNTTTMCHSVSLVGIAWQMGAWDMVAESWQVDTLRDSKLSRTPGKCRKLVFGLLKWQNPRIQISKSKIFLLALWHILYVCCQLGFCKKHRIRHEISGQSHCPTSWD